MVFTRTQLTSDHSPRTVAANMAVLHHAALTGSVQVLVNMMMPGGRTVSAHAAIKDGEIVNVVPLNRRAWSLGDAYWDSRAYTAECVNSTGAPGWNLSQATHESIARFVAEIARRGGWWPHRDGNPKTWTVIGHREVYTIHGGSYATACPGGMNLGWITKRAQEILGGKGGAPASAAPVYYAPGDITVGVSVADVQRSLVAHGISVGPHGVDGEMGPNTLAGIYTFQQLKGLERDGIVGPKTWAELQKAPAGAEQPIPGIPAPPYPLPAGWYFGPKSGPRESVSGYFSYREDLRRWQQRMKDRGWIINPDGLYGPQTAGIAREFQQEKGLQVDGLVGPETWKAAWEAPIT